MDEWTVAEWIAFVSGLSGFLLGLVERVLAALDKRDARRSKLDLVREGVAASTADAMADGEPLPGDTSSEQPAP